MIHFVNAGKWYVPPKGPPLVVLEPTTLSVPTNRRVGLLGPPQSGLSTLLYMIAGQVPPSVGSVVRDARVSPPVGLPDLVNLNMTAAENAAFMARMYNTDPLEVIDFVLAFSELGKYEDLPARDYSRGLRARVAFAISYALHFDYYLIDEHVGPRNLAIRERCLHMLNNVYRDSGILFASHSPEAIRMFCDLALVLKNQTLIPFSNIEEAILYHDED